MKLNIITFIALSALMTGCANSNFKTAQMLNLKGVDLPEVTTEARLTRLVYLSPDQLQAEKLRRLVIDNTKQGAELRAQGFDGFIEQVGDVCTVYAPKPRSADDSAALWNVGQLFHSCMSKAGKV